MLIRRTVLQEEFVSVPSRFIDLKLRLTGNFYAAYLALELAEYTYADTNNPGYTKLKSPRKVKNDAHTRLDNMDATSYGIPELKQEIQAARKRRKKEDGGSIFLMFPNERTYAVDGQGHFAD